MITRVFVTASLLALVLALIFLAGSDVVPT